MTCGLKSTSLDILPMFSDLGEVKTFYDLGVISAGVSSIELDKISCFSSAVTGFAPLIYLQKRATLREVVEAITAVKRNCDADKKLLEKWVCDNKEYVHLPKEGDY